MTEPKHDSGKTASGRASEPHWAHMPENTFLWGIRTLLWVRKRLGAWPLMLCMYPVVLGYWATNARARAASRHYLQRLQDHTGAVGHAVRWTDTLKHFLAFAETIMDKLLAISNEPIAVQEAGMEGLLEVFTQQRGAVIVTAHIGCLELCRVSAEHNPQIARLNILVHTAHAERFNRLLKQLRPNSRVQLLQVSEFSAATAVMLAEKIERGESVVIAGDRIPLGQGLCVQAPFLGQPALFPAGPYVLAASLKCPLYALSCIRSPYLARHYRYHIRAHRLAEQVLLPRASRQQALAAYAEQYALWLQTQLEAEPLAWFNFFNFWQQGRTSHEPPKGPNA